MEAKYRKLHCLCGTNIVDDTSSAGLLLSQFLKVLYHLQGLPHNMARPIHSETTKGGNEIFSDHYNHGHTVLLRRRE